jgi:8-oxo-dGTP pyrophosphatase MutT (NUDIX family)
MFVHFIEKLKIRLQQPLPGEDVQYLMAPVSRLQIKDLLPENYNPKKSAVMILLFPDDHHIKTVFIERPIYDGVHSGQVAFPGGKFEETDVELQQTALRETFEEIGVDPDKIEIIGQLTDLYINPSNFLVSPFIGYINEPPDFVADAREVQKIVVYNLFDLSNEAIRSEKEITFSEGFKLKTPYYDIEGLTVWGATAMMISELNAVIEESKTISL